MPNLYTRSFGIVLSEFEGLHCHWLSRRGFVVVVLSYFLSCIHNDELANSTLVIINVKYLRAVYSTILGFMV